MESIRFSERGAMLGIEFVADAFLHHMIRNIMGCLFYIGSGREKIAWMQLLLQARDRRLGAPTFAPEGLYLTGVDYGAEHPFSALSWNSPSVLGDFCDF